MTKRKQISKRTRFEVLKRDSFTCQYCGKMPPDVTLHIDHIKPVSKGGNNGMLNLVTSCVDCNLGKSNIELSDDSAVKKQQTQLAALSERKIQIEMMIDWKESLVNADELLVDSIEGLINKYLEPYEKSVNEHGKSLIRKSVKKNGYQKVFDSVESTYASTDDFSDNWSKSLKCYEKTKKPSIHYIKGILKNRLSYLNERKFYAEVNDIELTDATYEILLKAAKSANSIGDFWVAVDEVNTCQ